MSDNEKMTEAHTDFINEVIEDHDKRYQKLLQLPIMEQRKLAVTKRLRELHPPEPWTEMDFRAAERGQPPKPTTGKIPHMSGSSDRFSFLSSGDFTGLSMTHAHDM